MDENEVKSERNNQLIYNRDREAICGGNAIEERKRKSVLEKGKGR